MIANSALHYVLIKEIIEKGAAPELSFLANHFGVTEEEAEKALYTLQDDHGVVLHPHKPSVWVIHPFSLAPTSFYVRSEKGEWWGNCAWCSLGIAALLKTDVTIYTTLGAEGTPVTIHIEDGEIREQDLYIHFPIPMKKAWDNVIYTCSTMLVFESEAQVNEWSKKHRIPRGDIQPIQNIWNFSKKWYGNHLNPDWKKWTVAEAKQMFAAIGLDHEVWKLEDSTGRF